MLELSCKQATLSFSLSSVFPLYDAALYKYVCTPSHMRVALSSYLTYGNLYQQHIVVCRKKAAFRHFIFSCCFHVGTRDYVELHACIYILRPLPYLVNSIRSSLFDLP